MPPKTIWSRPALTVSGTAPGILAQWEQACRHDFPTDAEGKAIPYGVYDMGRMVCLRSRAMIVSAENSVGLIMAPLRIYVSAIMP